jgi:hypothetical protein
MSELGAVIIQQQSFLEKFNEVTPPALSQTLREYITENHLEASSPENFNKITEHADSLSSEHASHGAYPPPSLILLTLTLTAKGFAEVLTHQLKQAPDILKLPVGENFFANIKESCPNVFENATKEADKIVAAVTAHSPELFSASRAVGKDLFSYLQDVNPGLIASAVSSASGTIASVAVEAVEAIGSGVSAVISAIPGEAILQAAGVLASAFPFLYPLHILLSTIGNAIREAKYNRESANALLERCLETERVINELASTLAEIVKDESNLMKPLELILEECLDFLKKFTQAGFMKGLWQGFKNTISHSQDEHRLSLFDKRIVGAVQNLSLRISNQQLKLQVISAERMDRVFDLLSDKCQGKGTTLADIPPTVMAEVAMAAGCDSPEEITHELEGIGYQLEEIKKAVDLIAKKIDVLDTKVDDLHTKLDEHSVAQQKAHALQLQTLEEMRHIKSLTGVSVTKQFSNRNELALLSQKWASKRFPNAEYVCVHPDGVGRNLTKSRDGTTGVVTLPATKAMKMAQKGKDGQSGQDGDDGEDGDDGADGEDGHDGGDGEDAGNFEVMIECVDKSRSGVRTYRVEYAGRAGKDSTVLELPYPHAVIDINAAGGLGGPG